MFAFAYALQSGAFGGTMKGMDGDTTPTATTDGTPVPASATTPLTNPSDLWTLLSRFVMCAVLFVLTVITILRRDILLTAFLATASFFLQRATVKLYRRLRNERADAEAARADLSAPNDDTTQTKAAA